ncbi:hypothetical protein [Clostridium ihumii]|uniref:hypothetical protein n=1 Tax=Clostridium ihumii TaxID=1470356 RepID=UPI003D32D042
MEDEEVQAEQEDNKLILHIIINTFNDYIKIGNYLNEINKYESGIVDYEYLKDMKVVLLFIENHCKSLGE